MTPARLLVPVLLLCPAFLFAQENLQKTSPMNDPPASRSGNSISAPRIDPLGTTPAPVPQDPLARLESSLPPRFNPRYSATPSDGDRALLPEWGPDSVISPGQLAGGTCYAIRSYVVARDSKDSDSVHPAGYSTCVASNKVQLKSATGSARTVPSEK